MNAPLPDVLQRIEEELGQGAMLTFAHAFGGQRINIPRKVRPNSPLAAKLGEDLARKIVDVLGGGADITVPLGPAGLMGGARRKAYELLSQGASTNEVVRAVGLHEVTIRRARKRLRDADDRQTDLFKGK